MINMKEVNDEFLLRCHFSFAATEGVNEAEAKCSASYFLWLAANDPPTPPHPPHPRRSKWNYRASLKVLSVKEQVARGSSNPALIPT